MSEANYKECDAILDKLTDWCVQNNVGLIAKQDGTFVICEPDNGDCFENGVIARCIAVAPGRRIYQPGRYKTEASACPSCGRKISGQHGSVCRNWACVSYLGAGSEVEKAQ